ncbi:aldo/keto reductase [Parashewanella curva]|uniref:Aldo/keto reductase n=1 Tax=Parashewanella curva TaxID=2338552 RepID=A0A3L8Q0V9_9GAMM|nr:aldo/keto reductase [Parashewanella curva]RLV61090.1 aldo/keto reductase [Parashewanella curva]
MLLDKRKIGNTSLRVDSLGFGCASVGNLYRMLSDQDACDVLNQAWEKGFRHFDTAPHYGQGLSERRVGDMLRSRGESDYVLSTKVGRILKPAGYAKERHGFRSTMPFDIEYDYSYDGVMRSFEHSLQRLGLDRIDILYMHDIGSVTHGDAHELLFDQAMTGGYKAMDELRQQGVIKAIGLGVNEYQVCEQALEHGDWDCFLLAGRYTLLEQEALHSFLPKCEQRNCSIIIGGPYNSGILATGTRKVSEPYYNYAPAPQNIINKVAKIEAVCDEFGLPIAAAALQFPLAHPCVASVIPGVGKAKMIQSTLDLFNADIPAEFWQSLILQGLISDSSPIPKAK